MIYSFQPEAEKELIEAIAHYEEQQEGLGIDFSEEVFSAIDRILLFPHAWPLLEKEDRRMLLNTFPFCIIYSINEDKNECIIYAVMHQRQKPGYWKTRKF